MFILKSVLETIRAEVRKAPLFKETGGPLAGYVSADGAAVVTHATGPGPRAKLGYFSVVIDGRYAQVFCDRVYRETSGRLDYLGDWHRHPGWSLTHSRDDLKAMREMAGFEHCPVANPVSLIYRSFPEKYAMYVLNDWGDLELASASELDEIPWE